MTKILELVIFPLVVTALWEFLLRDHMLPQFRKVKYRLRNIFFGKEVKLGIVIESLEKVCIPDERTKTVLSKVNLKTIAVDGCFEILHSHLYGGWRKDDISFLSLGRSPIFPDDIKKIAADNQPTPPNNGKYHLLKLVPDTTEDPVLHVQLAATDYFSTYPIQKRLFRSELLSDNGLQCSPFEKYGHTIMDFENTRLPNIVCCHVIVVIPGNKLLLSQRLQRMDADWHPGKWSCSFEEQMTVKIGEPRNDKSFFDTVIAGLEEEFGIKDQSVEDIKVLSLVLETDGNVVDAIAITRVTESLKDIQASCLLKARDGINREIMKVEEIAWNFDALLPILKSEVIHASSSEVIKSTDWHATSRMRILVSLFHEYGIEKTLAKLKQMD